MGDQIRPQLNPSSKIPFKGPEKQEPKFKNYSKELEIIAKSYGFEKKPGDDKFSLPKDFNSMVKGRSDQGFLKGKLITVNKLEQTIEDLKNPARFNKALQTIDPENTGLDVKETEKIVRSYLKFLNENLTTEHGYVDGSISHLKMDLAEESHHLRDQLNIQSPDLEGNIEDKHL